MISVLGQATFFNQNFAWPFTTTRNLENTDTNEDTSEIIVYYWSEDFSAFLGSHNITTGEFHVPETDITALPSAATIGQSGTLGRYESLTDDNYYTLQWSIAQETETTAKLTFLRGYSDTTIEQKDLSSSPTAPAPTPPGGNRRSRWSLMITKWCSSSTATPSRELRLNPWGSVGDPEIIWGDEANYLLFSC